LCSHLASDHAGGANPRKSEHSFGSQCRDLLRSQAEQLCHDLIGAGANGWSGPAYLTGGFGHMGHDARVKDATKSRIIHFPTMPRWQNCGSTAHSAAV